MARHLPAQTQPRQVIHYVDAATAGELTYVTPAELAARRHRDEQLYLRWKQRQAAIAARDAKARRFWLGFGAMLAIGVLAVMSVGGWLLWQYLASFGAGVLAIPLIIGVLAATAVGGHRCITIVQHWH